MIGNWQGQLIEGEYWTVLQLDRTLFQHNDEFRARQIPVEQLALELNILHSALYSHST